VDPSGLESCECSNKIDFKFIHELEGFRLKGYVPDPKHSKSGVTIASGFDLGARNNTDLKSLGLNKELISKLDPYLGKKGTNALKYLKNNPLKITQDEGDTIDKLVKNSTIKRLTRIYNKKSKIDFNCLTKKQQTVVASVFFQYGTETPKFFKYATSQQWDKVSNELRNFGDIYPTRRNKEADYLKGKK